MFKEKIRAIRKEMKRQNGDVLVLANAGHQIEDDLLYYLFLIPFEYACLVLPQTGPITLYGISFEVNQLAQAFPECRVKPFRMPWKDLAAPHVQKGQRIGIRPDVLPLSIAQSLRAIPGARVERFRNEAQIMGIKSAEELRRMREAARITDEIFSALVRRWKRFKTEQDAGRFILTACAERGVEASFPPIIASGMHAAHPHHQTAPLPIKKGFCVIDMGVRFEGYCSDMTRTLFVGNPTKKEKELYAFFQEIQENTIREVRPGASIASLDAFCRDALGKEYSRLFIHSLGHGLGTQVHEWPSVNGNAKESLEPGMVITIEPGIYKENAFGMRIEDDVAVTKAGPDVLTKTTKDLVCI